MTLEDFLKATNKSFYTLGASVDRFDGKTRFYVFDRENAVISFDVFGNDLEFINSTILTDELKDV